MPKNSPKGALLDAPLPFETRPENQGFFSLVASSKRLAQLPLPFDETTPTPHRSCKLTGHYTRFVSTVAFVSRVRYLLFFSSHSKIPRYGMLLYAPHRSADQRPDFSEPRTTVVGVYVRPMTMTARGRSPFNTPLSHIPRDPKIPPSVSARNLNDIPLTCISFLFHRTSRAR